MDKSGGELVGGLVVARGPKRCRYSEQAKRSLAQLATRPGISVARLALTHGINANLLRKWMREYSVPASSMRQPTGSETPAATVLVPVNTLPAEVRSPATSCAESCIEIVWAAATVRVRGPVDSRTLGIVLDCLAQRA